MQGRGWEEETTRKTNTGCSVLSANWYNIIYRESVNQYSARRHWYLHTCWNQVWKLFIKINIIWHWCTTISLFKQLQLWIIMKINNNIKNLWIQADTATDLWTNGCQLNWCNSRSLVQWFQYCFWTHQRKSTAEDCQSPAKCTSTTRQHHSQWCKLQRYYLENTFSKVVTCNVFHIYIKQF